MHPSKKIFQVADLNTYIVQCYYLSLVSRGCVGRILVPAVTGWKEGATNALLTPFGIPWTPWRMGDNGLVDVEVEEGNGREEVPRPEIPELSRRAAWLCCLRVSRTESPLTEIISSSRICSCLISSLESGIRYFLTSVRANAILAWASAGGANAVISTWRSSWRCWYFGSWEALNSSSWNCLLVYKQITKQSVRFNLEIV